MTLDQNNSEEMSDFTSSSHLRKFQIVLLGGTLYVNPYWLAELSPYFAQVCLDENFAEAREGRVSLEGEEYEDVLAMLEYLCPDRNFLLKKKIGDSNLASLIHCCHRFQVPSLQKDLENFIETTMTSLECHLKADSIIEAILEAQTAHFRSSLLRCLYQKLGENSLETIRDAMKNLPPLISDAILEETTKYIQVIVTPVLRPAVSYNWNDYSKRMFF